VKKLRVDDEVVVIAGRDKGRTGRISEIRKNGRVLVSGVNMITKHVRPNPQAMVEGGRVSQEASIHASNLALWNSDRGESGGGDRVGIRVEDERKVRYFKSTGTLVPERD
jgi:large subunit ribosomal protein L24